MMEKCESHGVFGYQTVLVPGLSVSFLDWEHRKTNVKTTTTQNFHDYYVKKKLFH